MAQEMFALNDFVYLPTDNAPKADFRKMLCTLTLEWSEFATGSYPESGPPGRDLVRTLFLDAGEIYRLDYLCEQTVVALKPQTAELIRAEQGAYIRDDRDKLKAIARAAHAWYSQIRRAVTFGTSLINSKLQVGHYITAIGDDEIEGDVHTEDINSVITSIEIKSPSVEGEGSVQPSVPTIRYETAFGELDVLKFR
jgi:hypothetical protein